MKIFRGPTMCHTILIHSYLNQTKYEALILISQTIKFYWQGHSVGEGVHMISNCFCLFSVADDNTKLFKTNCFKLKKKNRSVRKGVYIQVLKTERKDYPH